MYIYKVTNLINGKVYIGQCARDVKRSMSYYGSGKLIRLAIEKYGIESFEKTVLEECSSKEELDMKEREYIQKYNSVEHGYNISLGGNGGNLGPIVNEKISQTVKSQWESGKYDHVVFPALSGKRHTEETKQKLSIAQQGDKAYWYNKKLTDEHREKISRATKIAYDNPVVRENFMKAIHSEEYRKKASESRKGMSPWNKGKSSPYSEETIEKMRESAKNRNISEEMESLRRKKISKAFSENHPNSKSILDTRTGKVYKSLVEFCKDTNTSWYKTKKMRKNFILKEIVE